MLKKKMESTTLETLSANLTQAVEECAPKTEAQEEKRAIKYVVVRDNHRVSDAEYDDRNDPVAIAEKNHWQKVVSRYPDGTKISIVQYDNKIHRIHRPVQ